jgi:hypothetical protein
MMNDKLIAALIEAQKAITHASKDGKNPYFKSDYATLEEVITTVKPPLNDNGVMFQQVCHPSDIGVCVETVFYGHGGELRTGQFTVPADKRDPQGFGSALTYAKRYSLSMACGVGHQKDDDAETAMIKRKKTDKVYTAPKVTPKVTPKELDALNPTDTNAYYKIMKQGTLIQAISGESGFLNECRKHLANPDSDACKEIYTDSKAYIQLALDNSPDGSAIKNSFNQLITLYRGA